MITPSTILAQLSASTPYLFQKTHQPETNYVGIPAVVSQTRNFYPAAHLPPEVIAGNELYVADDPEGL
ncbi:type IIL restriction-modification enzyme MmeI [Corynebacterium sp. NML 150383]|uniref:type IIL restriction-modification enzyme MmeI n=1 Tax=Corynebacterium sp. NML 150383 TaxID=2029400 RepID=UPI0011774EA2|nr:type IIL restriction-modification enzyme MmeI [Corynebacterium sp. NML 150383]